MGGGIYLTIPDMPGCVDITESICVGGGILKVLQQAHVRLISAE